ncbi:MAG: 50S ribosomal protein L10 [bacterium]|nr:50S ribosomal protein L10 [bacterium]
MPKTKAQKEEISQNIRGLLDKNPSALAFLDFQGIPVKKLSELRGGLQKKEGKLLVAKKTLFQRVFQEKGIKVNPRTLEGQVAVTFAFGDPVETMKHLHEFKLEKESLRLLGGYMEGEWYSPEQVKAIASLAPKPVLLAQLVGSIASPLSGTIGVLQGTIKGLLTVLQKAKA